MIPGNWLRENDFMSPTASGQQKYWAKELREAAHMFHPPSVSVSEEYAELSRRLINAAQEIEGRRPTNPEGKMNMENQHRKIKGYRELNKAEIEMMNVIKEKGVELGDLIESLQESEADGRWVSIGKTHFQEGLMALTRSVAKPGFF